MLDLHKYMTFPIEMLQRMHRAENFDMSCEDYILPTRSGLKRRAKTLSKHDWENLNYDLDHFEMFDPGEGPEAQGSHEINYTDACMVRNWLSLDHMSVSKALRMQLSWDPEFTIPRRIRWALQIYEQVIRRDGAIDGSAGHTILPYDALLDTISSPTPLGWFAERELPEEERGDIHYMKEEAKTLLDEMVAESLIAYMALEGDPKAAVYVPGHLALEVQLIHMLEQPVVPEVGKVPREPLMDSMDDDQKAAFLRIVDRKAIGFGLGGFPGAGKTYLTGRVAEFYGAANCLALATTGAAAQVLAKTLPVGVTCFTISSAYCNRNNPSWQTALNRSVLVVDECSMLNIQFLMQLCGVIESFNFDLIIITGDPKQLPPIGAGSLFENLMRNGYPTIEVAVLTKQHRMDPAALALLSNFERTVKWDTVLSQPGETNYGRVSLPKRAFDLSPNTHKYEAYSAMEILRSALANSGGFSRLTSPEVASSHLTRWLMSAFLSKSCDILSNCLEAARAGYDTKPLIQFIALFETQATKASLENSGRIPPKKYTTQRDKYHGNFLFDRMLHQPTTCYRDDLEATETRIAELYRELTDFVKSSPLAPGSFVRCNKNLNFTYWSRKRCDAERKKYGIACHKNLANGLTFYVRADGVLFNSESGTEVVVIDRRKASKLFKLAWCSTTHKLQGDQGARSYYVHTSSKAETKLVYVALSRGREKNVCLVNKSDAYHAYVGPQMSQSVKRLSALAVRTRGML